MLHTANAAPTPAARLAASRAALVHQMMPFESRSSTVSKTPTNPSFHHGPSADHADDLNHETSHSTSRDTGTSIWQFAKLALAGWWQHHPLHVAADVAQPYLGDYARNKPLQLIAFAAGLGALAVVIKPWRLVSVSGLAVLAAKSTNLSATLLSFLSRSANATTAAPANQPLKDS